MSRNRSTNFDSVTYATNTENRELRVGPMLLLLAILPFAFACSTSPSEPSEVTWLKDHAVTVRSLDPTDEQFADLEPLRAMIGDAKIVLLGEQTHGDGSTFKAKVRIIKFLHQQMGFDVVAFESGMYDCQKAWQMIQAGTPVQSSAESSVFTLWSLCTEVKPLFAYMQSTLGQPHPLELAGMDCQVMPLAKTSLVTDLEDYLAARGAATPSDPDWETFTDVFQQAALSKSFKPSDSQRQAYSRVLERLLNELAGMAAAGQAMMQLPGFWIRAIGSYGRRFESIWDARPDGSSRRDGEMAQNLLWLNQVPYLNRKLIVWAASLHAFRNQDRIDILLPDLSYGGKTFMGNEIWKAIGSASFVVGFTAFQGYFTDISTNTIQVLPPASPGSIEALMSDSGFELGIIDYRHLGADGSWLQAPLLSRPLGNGEMKAVWPQIMDALFFVKTANHSTPPW